MNGTTARPIPGSFDGAYWRWKTWQSPQGHRKGMWCAVAAVPHWHGLVTAATPGDLRRAIGDIEIKTGQAVLLRNAGMTWRDIALRLGLDSPWAAKAFTAWYRGTDPGRYIYPGPRPGTQPEAQPA